MTQQPWYRELFDSGDYLRFWLGAGALTPERTEREVSFLVQALALPPGARVLDLCCGHGRHSIALARHGYDVIGLDLSGVHLEIARRDAAEAGVQVGWVHADMRDIPAGLAGTCDAVLNLFTGFGYLESDAEDQHVLDGVARALKPGGRFLIDYTNRDAVLTRFRARDWEEVEGALLLHQRTVDLRAGRHRDEMTIVDADGSRHKQVIDLRWYTAVDLETMIRRAGLEVVRAWGDFDGSDLGLESRRVILMAEKPRAGN